jgi:adenylate cyclase
LYLQARYFWNQRTAGALEQSIALFRQAVERDPNYAQAYAGLGEAYIVLLSNREVPDAVPLQQARDAVRKALELDDYSADAHACLGLIHLLYDRDTDGADREWTRALELNPSSARAHHWHSEISLGKGQFPAALAEVQVALELDPLSVATNSYAGFAYYVAGEQERAIAQLRKTLELGSYWKVHRNLGWAYEEKGMHAEAIAEHQTAVRESGSLPEALGSLAEAYARAGKPGEARAILAQLSGSSQAATPYETAAAYAALGETDHAFKLLEQARQEGSTYLLMLRIDPRFRPLRSSPQYEAFLKRVG